MRPTERVIWTPQPRQAAFMERFEDEELYGGAAGGGKSDCTLTLYVRYNGGEWEKRAALQNAGERLWYVPLPVRACHSLGVRVEATGNYRICALVREYK